MKILFLIISFIFSISTNAQEFGVQLLVGKNIFSVNSMEKSFNLIDLTKASLTRESISIPYSGELNFSYKNIDWSLNLSVEAAYTNYDVIYSRSYPQLLDPLYIKTSRYNIDFAIAAFNITYIRHFNLTSKVSWFLGGGAGLFITAPVISDKFIINTLLDKLSELDTSGDIKLRYSLGGLLDSGIKFKYLKPIYFIVELKYLFTTSGEYEEPNNFPVFQLGLGINF